MLLYGCVGNQIWAGQHGGVMHRSRGTRVHPLRVRERGFLADRSCGQFLDYLKERNFRFEIPEIIQARS